MSNDTTDRNTTERDTPISGDNSPPEALDYSLLRLFGEQAVKDMNIDTFFYEEE